MLAMARSFTPVISYSSGSQFRKAGERIANELVKFKNRMAGAEESDRPAMDVDGTDLVAGIRWIDFPSPPH